MKIPASCGCSRFATPISANTGWSTRPAGKGESMEHPFAITLDVGTSLINHTGSWRTLRPEYVHRLPPCNHACPAGEDIQGWLAHAESGDYEAAWRALT